MAGAMSTYPRETLDSDRHLAAVARSLGWALESAARGDYADALGWVRVVEAIGDPIPPEYQVKRQAWLSALAANPGVMGES
jgi:alkylated DNA nucleotide flippase Atl1